MAAHFAFCFPSVYIVLFRAASENKGEVSRCKTGLSTHNPIVSLLTILKRFLCSSLCFCALVVLYMAFVLSLFVLNLSPSFGAWGKMYFVTVAFPGYLHL